MPSCLRYAEYRQKDLFGGSGVVETGCRTGVGKRLKHSVNPWSKRHYRSSLLPPSKLDSCDTQSLLLNRCQNQIDCRLDVYLAVPRNKNVGKRATGLNESIVHWANGFAILFSNRLDA